MMMFFVSAGFLTLYGESRRSTLCVRHLHERILGGKVVRNTARRSVASNVDSRTTTVLEVFTRPVLIDIKSPAKDQRSIIERNFATRYRNGCEVVRDELSHVRCNRRQHPMIARMP